MNVIIIIHLNSLALNLEMEYFDNKFLYELWKFIEKKKND